MPKKGKRYNRKTYSDQQIRRGARNRRENKRRLALLKKETGCQCCGRKDFRPEELHAHHLGPKFKNIAWLLGRPWSRVMAEITGEPLPGTEKCGGPVIFVCQECHSKIHRDDYRTGKNGRASE